MASEADFEALGLLDGLDGDARRERVDLICWLLDRGFDVDHIRGSAAAPFTLPASRVIGDDGTYVSARQICTSHGIEPLCGRLTPDRRPRGRDAAAGRRRGRAQARRCSTSASTPTT
jgi:Adenylate cyclase regulatory domain